MHAPWVRVQQRKQFAPWLTDKTKELIKQRDTWKQRAKDLAKLSSEATPEQVQAWREYKKYRNQINNRKKNEEKEYKTGKMSENADSPEIVWENAKILWDGRVVENLIKLKLRINLSPQQRKLQS